MVTSWFTLLASGFEKATDVIEFDLMVYVPSARSSVSWIWPCGLVPLLVQPMPAAKATFVASAYVPAGVHAAVALGQPFAPSDAPPVSVLIVFGIMATTLG